MSEDIRYTTREVAAMFGGVSIQRVHQIAGKAAIASGHGSGRARLWTPAEVAVMRALRDADPRPKIDPRWVSTEEMARRSGLKIGVLWHRARRLGVKPKLRGSQRWPSMWDPADLPAIVAARGKPGRPRKAVGEPTERRPRGRSRKAPTKILENVDASGLT